MFPRNLKDFYKKFKLINKIIRFIALRNIRKFSIPYYGLKSLKLDYKTTLINEV